MVARKPATVATTIIAYVICTFGVQGANHFAINKEHYAAMTVMRVEPVIAMGITSMLIQGLIFALLFPTFNRSGSAVKNGIVFAWAIGGFLASYIALGEAGKYAIPSISSWFIVESVAAFVQYTLFGALLGLIHRQPASAN